MRFEIWICLDFLKSLEEQKQEWLNSFMFEQLEVLDWKVDNEAVLTLDIQLNSLEDLMILPYLLEDDIVIYGLDSDIIMTKADMQELGLD